MVKRRLGQNGFQQCIGGHNCSQLLELTDGAFAVVGVDITNGLVKNLPPGPGIGPDERAVKVPREVVFAAFRDLLPAAA